MTTPARARRLVAAAAHIVDGQIDRLDPRIALTGQRLPERADGGHLEQPADRAAVQKSGAAEHMGSKSHNERRRGLARLFGEPEQIGIRNAQK